MLCYEAGSCGYVVCRQLSDTGRHCLVVAPSRVPKIPGKKVKTYRKDAQKLARMFHSGNFTSIWVLDEGQEAMRDIVRARSDSKDQERNARLQLNGFLQRHGHVWPSGKSRWTKVRYNQLESISFPRIAQQVVLVKYINAVEATMEHWSLAPATKALVAFRGVDKLVMAILRQTRRGQSLLLSPTACFLRGTGSKRTQQQAAHMPESYCQNREQSRVWDSYGNRTIHPLRRRGFTNRMKFLRRAGRTRFGDSKDRNRRTKPVSAGGG